MTWDLPAYRLVDLSRNDDQKANRRAVESGGVTVAVITVGLGSMGQRHAAAYRSLDGASLIGGVDTQETARTRFEREFRAPAYESVAAAIDDLPADAVSVATPHAAHYEQTKTAVEADLSAFVEKPLTTNPETAAELVSLARERGVRLAVGYQRRFFPPVREIKRVLAEGRIGVPRMVSCHLGQGWLSGNADSWRSDPDLSGGGLLYDTGSHLLEELLWLLEGEPTQVAAVVDDRGQSVDVNSAVSMRLRSDGSPVTVTLGVCGDSTDVPSDEQVTIWGGDGRLTYRADRRIDPPTTLRVTPTDGATYRTTFDDGPDVDVTEAKLRDFVTAVAAGSTPAVPGQVGVVLAELRAAIQHAWRDERTVSVTDRLADRSVDNPFEK